MSSATVTAEPKTKKKAEVSPEASTPESSSLGTESIYGAPAGMPAFLAFGIQRKLAVGAVDDPLEREADLVADQVMSRVGGIAATCPDRRSSDRISPAQPAIPGVQRKYACDGSGSGQCEECRKREEELPGVPKIQRHVSGNRNGHHGNAEAPPIVHEALRSSGKPLDDSVRPLMENCFGRDFGDVRVHTDSVASESAKAVNALAYTAGEDVVFAEGQFSPDSTKGGRLLAHELTHVVQQGGEGTIRRFAGFEHELIGNATYADIDLGHGVVLTWGQVVAIAGDEYGSVEELQAEAATVAGRARLRGRLEHDGVRGPIPAILEHETGAHDTSEYVKLAMENVRHFAGGGTAVETWRSHHEEALIHAILSGVNADSAEWQLAQLTEAFGQHFLTDSFSAGHVRTPRAAIMAWYQTDFAPRALGPFLDFARQRVTQALADDLASQMLAPRVVISQALDAVLGTLLYFLENLIRDKFQDLFGLGISGAISGTLHDLDNERGLWVSSDAHPTPWMAFGDARLSCSPTTRDQAELAVITAREQLVQAQALGGERRLYKGTAPSAPGQTAPSNVPQVVHFPFDSSDLDNANWSALDGAVAYLRVHPEISVDLVGHTCPIGTDAYNFGLGMRRAEAVAAALTVRGVEPTRITFTSAGEKQLLQTNVSQYALNRRVEMRFRATGQEAPDLVWAQQALSAQFGPPYKDVERYIPHEAPGLNEAQEDWHWGTLTSAMAAAVDQWIASYVSSFKPKVLASKYLDDISVPVPDVLTTHTVIVHPRSAVEAMLNEVIAGGTTLVGTMVGESAANRSTLPIPPPVPCAPP